MPKSSKWHKSIAEFYSGRLVIVDAFVQLSNISWKNCLVPKKWEYKFDFQFDYHGWAVVK